jgi:glycosyltransferase involved in cell wall biosynthesis
MSKNKLSVIIPTYNEEDEIIDCLESLGKQTYAPFEIIVVDDGSNDRTVKRVKNLSKIVGSSIKLLKQNHKGPGAARNKGASKAKGEILVFVDADMTFDKDFLDKLTRPIRKGDVKGTFSKEEYVENWKNIWAKCLNINEGWPDKKRHPEEYPDEDRVFRAILKSEFKKVEGFVPGGYTDDYSLYEKLGYKSKAAKDAKFYHKNPNTLKKAFNQAKWVGKREYKMGTIGVVIALIRASFPASLIIGGYKSFVYKQPAFLLFKIVYDFGIFIGIIEMIFTKNKTK